MPVADPFTRQRRLPEVGDAGQLRISTAELRVGQHPGSEFEREYLERAGVGRLRARTEPPARDFPYAGHFRFSAPRALAEGSWRALDALRELLGVKP